MNLKMYDLNLVAGSCLLLAISCIKHIVPIEQLYCLSQSVPWGERERENEREREREKRESKIRPRLQELAQSFSCYDLFVTLSSHFPSNLALTT